MPVVWRYMTENMLARFTGNTEHMLRQNLRCIYYLNYDFKQKQIVKRRGIKKFRHDL